MFLWTTSKNFTVTSCESQRAAVFPKDGGFEKQNNLPSAFRVISKGSGNWFWHYIRGIFNAHKHRIHDTSKHSIHTASSRCKMHHSTVNTGVNQCVWFICLAGSNGMLHTKCSQTLTDTYKQTRLISAEEFKWILEQYLVWASVVGRVSFVVWSGSPERIKIGLGETLDNRKTTK